MSIPKINPVQKVLGFIREKRLIAPGEKLLVALSGGPDSVCLLHILIKLQETLDIELHVAHLNHQLRGAESDADAAYVAELARKFGVPATIESRDVKAYRAQYRISLEEAAREVRYTFLAETAQKIGAEKEAVGHTAADHVETILMHLIRGSALNGLRGLLPVSAWHSGSESITVIRPLLELKREETAAYCRRHRLRPRIDSSNTSTELFRNRVRQELLPLLRGYNPRVDEALQRMARLAADDLDFIENEGAARWPGIARQEGGAVILDRKQYLALPDALKRRMLREAVESLTGSLKDIEAGHVENVLAALEKPSGRTIGLPEGLCFTIEHDRYVLARDAASTCPFSLLEKEYRLKIPGCTAIPGGEIIASIFDAPEATQDYSEANNLTAFFDFAITGSDLTVRHRLEGDRFQPLGLPGLKKLNAFMIDARIPRSWRDRIPVVTAPAQIIWVAGWRIDERAKVTVKTEKVLRLELKRD